MGICCIVIMPEFRFIYSLQIFIENFPNKKYTDTTVQSNGN